MKARKRTAEEQKQLSMDLVFANADDIWKLEAKKAVTKTAMAMPFLTSDDVMERIPQWASTHEPRALGPVMKNAAVDNIIAKENVAGINSKRRSLHASPRTVWRSLIYKVKRNGNL